MAYSPPRKEEDREMATCNVKKTCSSMIAHLFDAVIVTVAVLIYQIRRAETCSKFLQAT